MAAYLTAVLLALSGLSASANATPHPIVRRHQKEDLAVQLDSAGEMKPVAHHGLQSNAAVALLEEARQTPVPEMCNDDFPLGKIGTSECSVPKPGHQLIYLPQECITAAKSAGATVHMDSFYVLDSEKDNFPKGCSMQTCIHDNTAVCYYYNGIADDPATPTGTPVCSRPRFEYSLAAGCPVGYQVVLDRNNCENLARCMTKNNGEPFVIGSVMTVNTANNFVPTSTRDRNDFPEGCFLADDRADVFYNPVAANKPTHPVGTPICNVTQFTKCSSTGCQAEDSHLVFQAHWATHVHINATGAAGAASR